MASGYGRGGRGAALLQALNAPVRKPGESPNTSPPHSTGPTPPQPVGRGALMQQLAARPDPARASVPQGRGQMPAQMAVPAPVPAQVAVPMGRGALLTQSLAQASAQPVAQPAVQPPPARPMGRGALAKVLGAQVAPGSAPVPTPSRPAQPPVAPAQAAPQRSSPPAQPAQRASPPAPAPQQSLPAQEPAPPSHGGQGDRPSNLEYMLQKLNLDQPAVVKKGSGGEKINLLANYIPVRCRNKGVYQYSVSFSPAVDARNMRFKLINEQRETIGPVKAFDGAILFLPIQLPQPETVLKGERPTDGQEITIRIKLVRVLPPASCVQPYGVIFKRIMSQLRLCQVGRHYYDPHSPVMVPQHKMEIWPGYITAIQEYEGGLMLLMDVSHRVLRCDTVLDIMSHAVQKNPQNFKRAVTEQILGKTVLTRYNNKTYTIDDIMWDANPQSTFKTADQEVSYVEYYKKAYNKKIDDLEQPLLVHRPKPKDRESRGDRRPVLEVICLVPELCYVTGLTDEVRKDFRIMKDLSFHTRVSPEQRQKTMRAFCENVNSHPEARAELEKWGLALDMELIRLEGRKLREEKILFANNKSAMAGPQADWSRAVGKERVISGVDIKNWLCVYTRRDQNKANDLIQNMTRMCPNMGWRVSPPNLQELPNDRTETYLQAIRHNLTPQTQVVVAIFPTSRDDRYNAFKKLCCIESPVPSQVINANTLAKREKISGIVQKIALQINCKVGGELWTVEIPANLMMVVGIDTYHSAGNKSESVGGFVASTNKECTRWFSRVCHQTRGQELIDGLKICMVAALRKYHELNNTLPTRIVVFRDGVGDGQLPVVADHEVRQLSSCFASFGEEYQPKLTVIVVQKRINTRLFAIKGRHELINPPPGVVMDHTVTRREWYDFFLVSQHVRQGTVTPTHYVVVHDESNWPPDRLQMLSYKMTHLYYNWPGTVRVPAPCQYAHKLAYLVGQNIHKDPSNLLSDRLFFL